MQRSVAIVGSGGNVGTELMQVFLEAGWAALPFTRSFFDLRDTAKSVRIMTDLATNIREKGGSFDLVINASAANGMEACEADKYNAFQVNVAAPAAMAQMAKDLGVPFVHFSTDYCFSGHDLALHEGMEKRPCGAYGRSKSMGEDAVLEIGGDVLILRLSSVFGRKWGGVLGVIGQALRGKGGSDKPCEVLKQIACPTSGLCIARATLHAANKIIDDPFLCGVYHLATKDAVWKRTHAFTVLETILGKRRGSWHVKEGELAIHRPISSVLRSSKFEHRFGYSLPTWQEDLKDVLPLLPPVALHPSLLEDTQVVGA